MCMRSRSSAITNCSGNFRGSLVESMGNPLRQHDHPNFEGLGFDLVHFELDDGVSGEIAFGHTGNFLSLHGAPHEVLLDRTGCSKASASHCSNGSRSCGYPRAKRLSR